jgi:hypothetical protein
MIIRSRKAKAVPAYMALIPFSPDPTPEDQNLRFITIVHGSCQGGLDMVDSISL